MAELAKAKLSWYRRNGTNVYEPLGTITAQVNPTELTFEKNARFAEIPIPGLDAPILQFVRGNTESVTVELFFDTTETGQAVTYQTDQVYGLVKIDPVTHAPPVCTLEWGVEFPGFWIGEEDAGGIPDQLSQTRGHFQCVVERVSQRFTLFAKDGTPLRAILGLTLKEYRTVEEQLEEIDFQSNDHTRQHVVQQGDTLPGIAARVLGSASRWRVLAEHNGLVDPRALEPGQVLEIPPIA
ncbi:MAG: LysM peptidoglycan-binding domain-containing protein [Sandaracinaceae bacterium]|nr:LysM peptidoglycan-binding domain-containing protein [Sandaracinaceae bacterium]